jgi:DNA-binding MarR family transcriptional regulator
MVVYMQVNLTKCKLFLQAISPSGNLFLLLTLQELRKQRLTYTAFYALQRAIGDNGTCESVLRQETGLADYEISRACKSLLSRGLITIRQSQGDKRVCVLWPTKLGIEIHNQILLAAAKELQKDFSADKSYLVRTQNRRLKEAAEFFRQGNRTLRGAMQTTIFDMCKFPR